MEEINKMVTILATFSDEALAGIVKRCEELGFNPDRGIISLQESLINLKQSKAILNDAIEKKKMSQLPLTLQRNLLSDVEGISTFIVNITNGADDIPNLVSAIDKLYTDIWTYGLHKLSDQLLGYAQKMNDLKQLELITAGYKKQLEQALALRSEQEQLLADLRNAAANIVTTNGNAENVYNSIKELEVKSQELTARISAILPTILQNEATSSASSVNSQQSQAAASGYEVRIREFFEEIEKYRQTIREVGERASASIDKNILDTNERTNRLSEMEAQIRIQLQQATGHSLFHSFQTRQGNLAKSKYAWIGGILFSIVAIMGLTIYIAYSTTNFNEAFFLKLSVSLPLIYAIIFCSTQYNRERRLEEEYAFKSNISISLIPYQELVEKIVDKNNPAEREKYAVFIIDAITKVFTSPMNSRHDEETPAENVAKQVSDVIESVVKPLEPIVKLIKK